MGFSLIRVIVSTVSWTTFSIGIVFNCFLLRLILRHTPKPMQIYSRILMQTCLTDIIFLIATTLTEPVIFSTAKGGSGRWLNGILGQISNPDLRVIGFAAFMFYCFCVYVSLFNYVVQFIYRYLVLNRSKSISLRQYFCMFLGSLTVPFVYCFFLGWVFYPSDGKEFLDDPTVAEMLDLNISGGQKILLAGQMIGMSPMLTYSNYYIICACTLAYVIIWVLGWRMHKFVQNRKDFDGNDHWRQQERINKVNKEINKNLLIQACLPFTILGPLLFLHIAVFFGINVNMLSWIQYYYMLSLEPIWLPPAMNPIITILTIGNYRKVFSKSINLLGQSVCCKFEYSTNSTGDNNVKTNSTNPNNNNNDNRR